MLTITLQKKGFPMETTELRKQIKDQMEKLREELFAVIKKQLALKKLQTRTLKTTSRYSHMTWELHFSV